MEIYATNIVACLKNTIANFFEVNMKTKNTLKNILNIIINILFGWFSFWWFTYALLFIIDRKDAEAESFVPIGYAMFIISVPLMITFRIIQLIKRENKKDYWIYNILPMIATLIIMILWCVSSRMNSFQF